MNILLSMTAVVRLHKNGSQYLVNVGDVVMCHRLHKNVGDEVNFEVLGGMNESEMSTSGKVVGRVLEHGKGKKVLVFKKLRRHNHRKCNGYRACLTKVVIEKVELKGNT